MGQPEGKLSPHAPSPRGAAAGPMFSTIMPVYNHAAYVRQAVRSVIAQTWKDWQLIIVDDGSTDGSGKIAEDLAAADARIAVIHQANSGASAARAKGLSTAAGRWLTYLDSDDVWFPQALANFAAYIETHPDARFIYGYRHRLNEDGSVTESPGDFQSAPTGAAELFERMYISHLCVCYGRELLRKAGGYDPALRLVEDYDLYLRMSLLCRLEPLGLPTGLRRRHAACQSRQTGYSRMLEAEVLRRFVEQRGGKDVLSPDRVRRRLGRVYYSAARQYCKSRCFRQALAALRMAHRYRRTLKSTAIGALARCLLPFGRTDGRGLPQL